MTSLNTPAAVQLKLSLRKTGDLIRDLIVSGIQYDAERDLETRMNLATVRGWLIDEIESRDPEAFEAWLDSDTDDDGLLHFYHC